MGDDRGERAKNGESENQERGADAGSITWSVHDVSPSLGWQIRPRDNVTANFL